VARLQETAKMTNGYSLAFDLGQPENLFGDWTLLIIPVAMALALGLRAKFGGRERPARENFYRGIAAIWGLVAAALIRVDFVKGQQLREAEAAGNAITLEGCLSQFHPESRGGHEGEQIDLSGASISYSSGDQTPGFHQTETHGGPVHKDSKVRVTSVFGTIVRLETWDHACPPAPDSAANGGP
jgi:hypothetical protein